MSCSPRAALCSVLLLLALAIASALQLSHADGQAAQIRLLQQKLALLDALLARSQNRSGLNADDLATLEVARTLTHVAKDDLNAANLQSVNASLDEALRLLGELSRRSATRSTQVDQSAYVELRASVDALLVAYTEVATARGLKASERLDMRDLQKNLNAANAMSARAQYQHAIDAVRRAYQPLVQALSNLRANETVRYRLVFASVEEELIYERRRLRSNELLLQIMLQERAASAAIRAEIDVEMSAAAQQKRVSEQQFATGDVSAALKSAEIANDHLSRALQKTGVYIGQ